MHDSGLLLMRDLHRRRFGFVSPSAQLVVEHSGHITCTQVITHSTPATDSGFLVDIRALNSGYGPGTRNSISNVKPSFPAIALSLMTDGSIASYQRIAEFDHHHRPPRIIMMKPTALTGQPALKMNWRAMDEVTQSYILFAVASVPWLCYGLVFTFFIVSIVYGRLYLHKKVDPVVLLGNLPGVSVIKPLMGVDPLLEGNLESHFLLNYPKFELLFCVQDDQDPAISLVNQLCERYPKVDCKLFIGGKDGILNPMVHNMAPAYEGAQYDLVWVSTSRITASTEILLDMVSKLQHPKCALVHQMPFSVDQKGIAAAVEKVYFGSSVARYYLALNVCGICCFTGMSYIVKKTELDLVNGLPWFGKFLAEDFFIAKMLHDRGFRHQVAAIPAQQNVSISSVAAYKDRMVRWTRLRLNMIPFTAAILEPLSESVPLGIYMSWSVYHFTGINPYLYFPCHWLVWCILDYIQLQGVQNAPLPFGKLKFLAAWMMRELMYVFVYFEAISNVRHIKWGRRIYRLSNFGESLEIVTDKAILPI